MFGNIWKFFHRSLTAFRARGLRARDPHRKAPAFPSRRSPAGAGRRAMAARLGAEGPPVPMPPLRAWVVPSAPRGRGSPSPNPPPCKRASRIRAGRLRFLVSFGPNGRVRLCCRWTIGAGCPNRDRWKPRLGLGSKRLLLGASRQDDVFDILQERGDVFEHRLGDDHPIGALVIVYEPMAHSSDLEPGDIRIGLFELA